MERWTLGVQRLVVLFVAGVVPLVFSGRTAEAFGLPKASLVVAAAIVAGVAWAVRAALTGRGDAVRHPTLVAAAAFVVVAGLATLNSDAQALSLVGHYPRFSGLILYAAAALLFVVGVRVFDAAGVRNLGFAIVAGGVGVAVYALVQWAGLDPLTWDALFEGAGVGSTVGNRNFVAAHLAIALPLAGWVVLSGRNRPGVRIAAGVVGVAIALALVPARSDQGWLAAGAGGMVLGFAWLLARQGRIRRYGIAALTATGVLGAVAVAAGGVFGSGPLGYLADKHSTVLRRYDWAAAWAMGSEYPLTGVGLDRYGAYYNAARPAAAAELQDLLVLTEAPHSVPLNMLASGGIPLAVAWVLFVGLVGWTLLSGLWRLEHERLLLLGGVGGAWAAYQAQAAVSIDVPSLLVTHWLLAAAIVVVAGRYGRTQRWLPWARPRRDSDATRKAVRRAESERVRRVSRVGVPLVVAIGITATLALWPVWRTLAADVDFAEAQALIDGGRPDRALPVAREAAAAVTWEPLHARTVGHALRDAGRLSEALDAYEDAIARDPRHLRSLIEAAVTAEEIQAFERAERWLDVAVTVEPNHPRLLADVGRFALRTERYERARELLERAVTSREEQATWWAHLGMAYEHLEDADAARHAYQRALELEPGAADVERRLLDLDP